MARARRLLLFLPALSAVFAGGAPAASIGDIVVESALGQPFRARVRISTAADESLDEGCVAAARPAQPLRRGEQFPERLQVTLERGAAGVIARLASPAAVDAPVVRFALRAGCGPALSQREYTLLLEARRPAAEPLPLAAAPPPAAAAEIRADTPWQVRPGDTVSGIARAIYPKDPALQARLVEAIVRANPAAFPAGDPDRVAAGAVIVIPDLRSLKLPPQRRAAAPAPTPAAAPMPAPLPAPAPLLAAKAPRASLPAVEAPRLPPEAPAGGFRLKLSSPDLDLTRGGRLSRAERELLREQARLIAALDDQTARQQELRHHIGRLESQVEELRLRIAQLPDAPAARPAAAPAPVALPAPARMPDTMQLVRFGLELYLLPAAQIVMAVLALFLLLRYYHNIRVKLGQSGLIAAYRRRSARRPVLVEAERITPEATDFDRNLVAKAAPPPAAPVRPVAESIDSILEEAQLYVIHGHPERATEMLEEQIRDNKGEVRVWMLLFVILRSQGMRLEFEKLARRFRSINHDPELWENIQALGHELDPENDLYLTTHARAVAGGPALEAMDLAAAAGAAGAGITRLDFDLGEETKQGETAVDIVFEDEPAPPAKS